jgi:hypothetical protein
MLSGLDGGEWSASRPCRFTPGGKPPPLSAHCIGGCMSPTLGLGAAEDQTRVVQRVAHRYAD